MRSSHFLLSAATFMVTVSLITASPVVNTVEQSFNSRAVVANNLVKRQSSPICSMTCGTPYLEDCFAIHENGAQFCDTTTFSASSSDECNISYQAPPDGTCTAPRDLYLLTQAILSNCLSGLSPSGGCIDGSNGARVCIFSSESPCH